MNSGSGSLWERWDEVDQLFEAALDRPADDRQAFLETECGDDSELLQSVLELLTASQRSEGLFEVPGAGASIGFIEELGSRTETPSQIGRYSIVRELGRGGMGTVYLAEFEGGDFRQQVALKVLRRGLDTDDILQRFVGERRILAKLSHPNIARLYDGGATPGGRPYLVMEYVEGEPITEYCDRQRLDVRQRLRLVLQVADAVNAAHANLIVHRDLKPSNILVTADGHVKLLDFGIAKVLDPDEGPALTKTGSYVLTPDHASPEQLRGEAITTATDVYQLGVLLFRLLTGQRPFSSDWQKSTLELRELAERGEIPKPSTTILSADKAAEIAAARSTTSSHLRKILRGDLDTIAGKALNAEPSRRYPSAANLADDIRQYLDGRAISAQPDSFGYQARKFFRRHPWVAPVVVAAIVAVGIYIATLVRYTGQLEEERNTARLEAERAQEVQQFMVDLFRSADPYLPADRELGSEITVLDALAMGAQRVQESLDDRPDVRASILAAIADVYADLNKADEALPLQEEALRLQQMLHGPASRQARDAMGMLARLQDMRGEYAVAGQLHRDRLELALAAEPQDAPEVADAHIRIGRHLLVTSQLAEAELHFQAAVDLAAARDLSWEYVDALRSLADTQFDLGQMEKAEATARVMVPQLIEVRGEGTPASAYARGTLARILGLRGKAQEAELYFERAIEDLSNTLGADHIYTLATINNLAKTRLEAGDLEGAEPLFVHIIATGERAIGDDHPRLGAWIQAYGTLLSRAGRVDQAIEAHRRAAQIFRRKLGPEDPQRAEPLESLAELYLELDRAKEAAEINEELRELHQASR